MNKPSVTFRDVPTAPIVFVTEAVGFMYSAGNLHMTLASPRVDHSTSPGPVNLVVNLRVVMPAASALEVASALYAYLKAQGIEQPAQQQNALQ